MEMCISQNNKGGKSLEFTDLNIICEVTEPSHIRRHQDKYIKFPNLERQLQFSNKAGKEAK